MVVFLIVYRKLYYYYNKLRECRQTTKLWIVSELESVMPSQLNSAVEPKL